ncbi:MAG: DinB family protein [Roseiflexaceae bacterium]|jgi:hypothetical protein|nr:DinB family protein [Chloroflexaceae bacterium]
MLTIAERQQAIELLRNAHAEISAVVAPLSTTQLTTVYIANEWTVAQNIHHLPDAHSYAINNVRLVLTEDKPTWKPYSPDGFAQLADAREADISVSLELMRAMHIRWVRMLESLTDAQFARTGISVTYGERSLDDLLRIYSGHTRSHIEQIKKTLAAGA